jgi:hypothetical protein
VIPYASTKFEGSKAFTVCPVCSKKIRLVERKDEESHSGIEYARHFEAAHPEHVVSLSEVKES